MMGEITGRKVLIFTVSAFAVIIAVNLTLAFQAVRTFPGLEVDNSYVASQEFDAKRAAQEALGWEIDVDYRSGTLVVAFSGTDGRVVPVADMTALVGRATTTESDATPAFRQAGSTFTAPLQLAPGQWIVRVSARAADGTEFRQRLSFVVSGEG